MRIVIDLQGRQSRDSRYRGIGRYSLSITKAIIRKKMSHEVFVVLTDSFKDTIDEIRKELKEVLPDENIFIWCGFKNSSFLNSSNTYRKTAELSRELYIKDLNPDVIYVTSLFEGFHDDTITSVNSINLEIPVAVTLYDLIPLMNKEIYLENKDIKAWYKEKLSHLKNADLLLSISESSRQEALEYLECDSSEVVNIKTAADPQFKKIDISDVEKKSIFKRYGIRKDILMYTGGIDYRKNIEGLIKSYALLTIDIRIKHQLAIVCSIDDNQKVILENLVKKEGLKIDEVVFTGFISENDLISLYNICKAFIFPSWHEGFGLPALEAMHCGAAVIASNSSSLPEVIGLEEALFDPKDNISMSKKIEEVLTDDDFRQRLIKHSKEQIKVFTWNNSAKIAIDAFEEVYKKERNKKQSANRLKLAYVSPLPPEHTGIADYSAELLPSLHKYYDIDVVVEQEMISDKWINDNCNILNSSSLLKNIKNYDRVIYHFGNSHFHQHMFKLIKQIPGVVVLHDFFLSGILYYASNKESTCFNFQDELNYSHGSIKIKNNEYDLIMKYPCNKRVLDESTGIIVHSEYSKELSNKWYGEQYSKKLTTIPLLRVLSNLDKNKCRNDLDFKESDVLICSFGIIDKTKQNHRLLDAWLQSSLSKNKNCKLIFVGEYLDKDYGKLLLNKINEKSSGNIIITGRTNNEVYKKYLSSADIGVQLRTSSRGETSAAILDCMNYEIASIVNANGSMACLDKKSVHMLSDEFTDDELVLALEKLFNDKKYRKNLGLSARKVIENSHSPKKCANQYVKAIEKFYLENNKSVKIIEEKKEAEQKNADKGLLIYGPYIALNNNTNLFKLKYFSNEAKNCKYDIVAKGGSILIKSGILSPTIMNGSIEELVELTDELKGLTFEFRVFYEGIGELSVSSLSINDLKFLGSDLPGQTGWVENSLKVVKEDVL